MNDRFITHFEHNEATRSQSILLELLTILGRYRDGLYLVGGWVPYFLLKHYQKPSDPFVHIGSIDIDLVIDESKISENQYSTIVELITDKKYKPRKTKTGALIPFSFEKNIDGVDIAVDFLAREYGGTSKKHRHQRIDNDLLARKARGADLLPEHHVIFKLDGFLPNLNFHA